MYINSTTALSSASISLSVAPSESHVTGEFDEKDASAVKAGKFRGKATIGDPVSVFEDSETRLIGICHRIPLTHSLQFPT